MKFVGELRIPDIDHPGIPATVVIDDTHIEIVLDGESLGRWSLYDVRAHRLISKAFALDLGGEDVTFLSEEPVDFAYRGVERMAEVWAQFKTMRGPQRMIAVRRSRAGATPSRVSDLRRAMEANLAAPREPRAAPAVAAPRPVGTALPPTRRPAAVMAGSAEPTPRPEADRERIRLQQVRARYEQLTREAAELDARRVELFRAEIARLKGEKEEAERIDADREALINSEMEKLKTDMRRVKEAEASLSADVDSAPLATLKAEAARLEAERVRLAELAEQRLAASRRILQAIEVKRTELERKEAERWQAHRKEMERLRAEVAELDRKEWEPATATTPVSPTPEAAPEVDIVDVEPTEDVEIETTAKPEAESDAEDMSDVEAEQGVTGPAAAGNDAVFAEEPPPGPARTLPRYEPVEVAALATPVSVEARPAEKKSGLSKSVRSAFLREKEPHEHVFVTAPGTMGISRSICSECAFVSIGAADE